MVPGQEGFHFIVSSNILSVTKPGLGTGSSRSLQPAEGACIHPLGSLCVSILSAQGNIGVCTS